jgi:hypothetical protein
LRFHGLHEVGVLDRYQARRRQVAGWVAAPNDGWSMSTPVKGVSELVLRRASIRASGRTGGTADPPA